MQTKPVYLVVDTDRETIVRSAQQWPTAKPGQIVVRLSIVIPDDLIPEVKTYVVEQLDSLGMVVEPEAVEA